MYEIPSSVAISAHIFYIYKSSPQCIRVNRARTAWISHAITVVVITPKQQQHKPLLYYTFTVTEK